MLICAAGDIHGAMDAMYEDVLAFEANLDVRFEWVLHVGDFGVWPDASRIDKATRKHDGAGDVPTWLAERRATPRKTLFIKGNHEDFVWLDAQHRAEVLPGLFYLRNGRTLDIGEGKDAIRVGGVGGCYGPSDYERPSKNLQSYAKRHYTKDEIEQLGRADAVDIVLVHDAPAGVRLQRLWQREAWLSEAKGLDELLARVRPKVCFFGHHHMRVDAEVAGVRCIGLNKVRRPGNLVALDFDARTRQWAILGEWPAAKTDDQRNSAEEQV